MPLERGTVRVLRRGESVVLHDRLVLLPSGRQFVFEDDPMDGTVGRQDGAAVAEPTMLRLPLHGIE